MALTTLASQTHETLSKIHETIVSFTTDTSKRDARVEELEQDCKKHIQKLETAFAEESSALEQKRKAEKDAIAEQRKKEDEERERKRRLEDEEMEMKARKEDEERKEALKRETAEVEDTTETLKAQAEAQMEEEAQRKWDERNGRLKALREEINRLIEEQLQMPLPLPKRESLWAAQTSPRDMPFISEPASAPPVAVESKILEPLPVAAAEIQSMSNPIVKAHEDDMDSLPAAEKSDAFNGDIDMESSLETLPRTTYSPDPAELSFAVPPVKISLATDVDKKEGSDRASVEDENNAHEVVSRSLPPKRGALDTDEDDAIARMPELGRVSSRDPSAEDHAQRGVGADGEDHNASDSESEYDEKEDIAVGGRSRSASAELAWWEQQQRKALESAGDAVGRVPEEKHEQLAAMAKGALQEVLERSLVVADESRRLSVVDEPSTTSQEVAESPKSSSLVARETSVQETAETFKPSSPVAQETSSSTRELDSKTTEGPQVSESHTTVAALDARNDVKDNDHGVDPNAHAWSESEDDTKSQPEPKLQGDIGSYGPNIHDAHVERSAPNIEQAQAAVDSMISPTSTVERGFQTTSVATPISHIELMSKKVHDELDMVESSPVDVISMGSPFERGSPRSFDATYDHDHNNDHSQLTADSSATHVDGHPVLLESAEKALADVGSNNESEYGDKTAGDRAAEDEPQVNPAMGPVADVSDHSNGASEPGSIPDSGVEDRVIPADLEITQRAAADASGHDVTDKPGSGSADENFDERAAPGGTVSTERASDVSGHDEGSETGSVSSDTHVNARSLGDDSKPNERPPLDVADRPDPGPDAGSVGVDVGLDSDRDSNPGWRSEDDELQGVKPVSKSLSEELAQDDSSEDPETLYDDDPLSVMGHEKAVGAEPAVQAATERNLLRPQEGNGGVDEVASLLHEQPSDEAVTKEQSDEQVARGSGSVNENKDTSPDAGKNDKETVGDVKANAGLEVSTPPVATSIEKDSPRDFEADAGAEIVEPPATITTEKENAPEAAVHDRTGTVAPVPAASLKSPEDVVDVPAHKPETLETQSPAPTQEETTSRDVHAIPIDESKAVRPEHVSLPAEDEDVPLPTSDPEHDYENSDTEAGKTTATAVHSPEAPMKAQVPNDISLGYNLMPPTTGFTDGDSQEFFTPMASAGLDSPVAEKAFFDEDLFDQGTTKADLQEEKTVEGVEHEDSLVSQPAEGINELPAHPASAVAEESVKANRLDQEIEADAKSEDGHNIPAAEHRQIAVESRSVPTSETLNKHHDLDGDDENELDEEAALDKVPTNETHSTNETNEQDSNNGYAPSQHELELEDGYSATVHGQDHLFDSDENNSGEDLDHDQDRDSLDEQYDKDATPIENVDNPFRDSAGRDDVDDVRVADNDDDVDIQHDGFEVKANLSVVEKGAAPENMTASSRGYSGLGDVDASDVNDGDDDNLKQDGHEIRVEPSALQQNIHEHGRDQVQEEGGTSVAPETMPADEHTSSESKVDSAPEETRHQHQDQHAPVLASPLAGNIHRHDVEDDTAGNYGHHRGISEQHVSDTPAATSTAEVDDASYDVDAQPAGPALPEPVSPTATRGLAASRHNPERDIDRPQTPENKRAAAEQPEASSSPTQNPFEGHDDADLGMETFAPRDVTNISWSSQPTSSQVETPHNQPQSRSRRDTDVDVEMDVDVESTPMSLRSASTLSSAPSSPVHASLLSDNHEPVIRDSWPSHPAHGGHSGDSSFSGRLAGFMHTSASGRPRGDSHLSNVSTSDYMPQDINPDLPTGGGKGGGSTFSLGPSPMRLWQRRDQGLAANNADPAYHRPVSAIDIGTGINNRDESDTVTPTAASASATTTTYRNSITGPGSVSGSAAGNTGPSLFQRMRSVFENNSTASPSATTPTTAVGGSRSNSPVVRSRPGSFYRSLEQHQQEQLAAKRLSDGLVRPGDVAAAYDRGHGNGQGHGSGHEDGDGSGLTCGYDELAGYLHHEHVVKTSSGGGGSRRLEGHSRGEYYDDDQSDDDSGEDASLLEHGGEEGECGGRGLGYDRHGRLTTAN